MHNGVLMPSCALCSHCIVHPLSENWLNTYWWAKHLPPLTHYMLHVTRVIRAMPSLCPSILLHLCLALSLSCSISVFDGSARTRVKLHVMRFMVNTFPLFFPSFPLSLSLLLLLFDRYFQNFKVCCPFYFPFWV